MPIITIYRCDRCEKEQDDRNQMWNVGVAYGTVGSPTAGSTRNTHLWCRKCMEDLHLLPDMDHKKEKEELPPKPTFEDLIRELVVDELGHPL